MQDPFDSRSNSLGDALAKARRQLGRSISEAESVTRIRAKLLDALEKGDYDVLPNPAYVRGYIISYAKFLELDPKPLLELYAEESGHHHTREQLRAPEQVVAPRESTLFVPARTALLVAAAIAIIALAVWGIGRAVRGPEELPPVPISPEATSTVDSPPAQMGETATIAPDGSDTAPTTPDTSAPPGTPFELRIDISPEGASWLRVTVDGLTAYEGTLAGGQSKEWQVTDTAVIRVGKPSAVTVTRNGTPVRLPTSENTPELTLSVDDPAE